MGFSPRELDEMTLWEFESARVAYRKAHATEEDEAPPPMDDDRLKELGIAGFN